VTGLPTVLPEPRTPDPAAAPPLRWGVLGTGWVAERFVSAVRAGTRQQVVAVGSRSEDGAQRAAGAWGVERGHPSYAALVEDPAVDVVYVATPHPRHVEDALLALGAGKHVLVEKPLAVDAAGGRRIAAAARERGLFCAEAMWSAFLPRLDVVRRLLADGTLGDVRTVLADIGESFSPDHRVWRAELAGGPMLDLGTYPVALGTSVLGPVERALATSAPAADLVPGADVDACTSAVLVHAGGRTTTFTATLTGLTPTSAALVGTAATLELPGPFYRPGDVVLSSPDGATTRRWSEPPVGHGALHFQAAEVARCVADGRTSTPLRTLEDSLTTLRALDAVRRAGSGTGVDEPEPRAGG